jgi:hypothetical protein
MLLTLELYFIDHCIVCPSPDYAFASLNKFLILLQDIRLHRAPTTFKLEGEVTSLSESSQGEVGDNREK